MAWPRSTFSRLEPPYAAIFLSAGVTLVILFVTKMDIIVLTHAVIGMPVGGRQSFSTAGLVLPSSLPQVYLGSVRTQVRF